MRKGGKDFPVDDIKEAVKESIRFIQENFDGLAKKCKKFTQN